MIETLSSLLSNSVTQYYIFVLIMLWPMARIFRRAGFAPWWAAVLAVPMMGYLLCAGLLTLRRWPANAKGAA